MKAAISCRVSTDTQAGEDIPILGGENECQSFARGKGREVVVGCRNDGLTGFNPD